MYICVSLAQNNQKEKKEIIVNLFKAFLKKREDTFVDSNVVSTNSTEVTVDEYKQMVMSDGKADIEFADLMKTGFFFPHFPVLRKVDSINITKDQSSCNKNYKKVNKLGAGVIFFYCVDHSTCIGFIILGQAESPKIITQCLLSRFKTMPQIILYDNACNLSDYILNRTPRPFENTKFYVDGFHYESHTNCSNSFNTSDHPEVTKQINTSLVEQKNSKLRFLKRTSPYLRYNTFAYKLVNAIMHINN